MISAPWAAPDFDDDQASSGRPAPTLASLHFVRSALRRRWLVCVLSAVLGLLAAAAYLVAFPASHEAKAALVLAHQPEDEASRAMATDVSLVKTRTLAAQAVASLGLTTTPDDFLKSVTVQAVSSELLSITLTAPSETEAIRRLEALTSIYLDFRGQQLSMQSNVYVEGIQQRIARLQGEVEVLSKRIGQLSADSSSASKLSDMIAQRAFIQGRIDTLQQEVEDVTLHTTSVVLSSRVIDPAATEAHAAKLRIALALASGLIGGAALGCGTVLFLAITSDRLRRRSDVAAALEVAVPVSVGRIAPLAQPWVSLPYIRALDNRRTDERCRLAHAIEMELPARRQSGRLGVVCIDNAREVSFAVATAALNLAADGRSVVVIDLTKKGSLEPDLVSSMAATHRPTVLRPRGVPVLAGGMADLRALGDEDGAEPSLDRAEVTLVLADFDPSVGADYLLTWTDRVFIVVTAGLSSAERVRTSADLVRSVGLDLRFAALLHVERTDDSSGTGGFDRAVPIDAVDRRDQAAYLDDQQDIAEKRTAADVVELSAIEEPVALGKQTETEEQAVNDEKEQAITALQPTVDEQALDEEQAATLVEQLTTEKPSPDEEKANEEQAANEEAAALDMQITNEEPTADEERSAEDQAAALQVQLTNEGRTDEQQAANEELIIDHEPAIEVSAIADLQLTAESQVPTSQNQATVDDQSIDENPTVDDKPTADALPGAHIDEASAQELTPSDDHQRRTVVDERPTNEEPTADEERSAEDQAAALQVQLTNEGRTDEQQAANEELIIDHEPAIEVSAIADLQLTAESQVPTSQNQATVDDQSIDENPTVDDKPTADALPGAHIDEASAQELTPSDDHQRRTVVDERPTNEEQIADKDKPDERLSLVENPSVQVGPSLEDLGFDWNWDWSDDPNSEQDSDSAMIGAADQAGPPAKLDKVAYTGLAEKAVDEWPLYTDAHPAAASAPGPSSNGDVPYWDRDSDDSDSGEASYALGAHDEADAASDELTTSADGSDKTSGVEADTHGTIRPAAVNGQVANGQGRQRTRTRTRRKRSRHK